MSRLLVTSVTLLAALTNGQAVKLTPQKIYTKDSSFDQSGGIWRDNLEPNNLIVAECHEYKYTSGLGCSITGVPKIESSLHACNVNFTAAYNNAERINVESIHRLKGSKLIARFTEWIPKSDASTSNRVKSTPHVTLRILDDCTTVKTLSFAPNGADLSKLVVYEDGFDVILGNATDKNDKMYYQNYNDKGEKFGEHLVPTEHTASVVQPVTYGKIHSQGFPFESGSHFYPNGTMLSFDNDTYKVVRSWSATTAVDDFENGYSHSMCHRNLHHGADGIDIICRQYDMVSNRRLSNLEANISWDHKFGSVRSLKSGILMVLCDKLDRRVGMFAFWMRPDKPTVEVGIRFPTNPDTCYVSDFDEETGRMEFILNVNRGFYRGNYTLPSSADSL